MGKFIRRQVTYFFWGFVAAFVLYLFIRYDADDVLLGIVIGAASGIATCIIIMYLEHKFFGDEPKKPVRPAEDL
jgi:mannose/fructose/N-acetylgalactosamine-specific phosphotransferase system component IIC